MSVTSASSDLSVPPSTFDDAPAPELGLEPMVVLGGARRAGMAVLRVVSVVGLGLVVAALAGGAVATVAAINRVRLAFGADPPADGVDWYLVVAWAVVLLVPVAIALLGVRRLTLARRRRFAELWSPDIAGKGLVKAGAARSIDDRIAHLRRLLESSSEDGLVWSVVAARLDEQGTTVPVLSPNGIDPTTYPIVAEAVRDEVVERLAGRAAVAGLAVGLSTQRWVDTLTIVGASFDGQIEALALLGAKPTPRTWWRMAQHAGASVFVNTYLTREDAIEARLLVTGAALGIDAAGELLGAASDTLDDLEMDEAVADTIDDLTGGGGWGRLAGTAVKAMQGGTDAVLGIGQVGAQQVAAATRAIGDELVQGVLVSAVLVHQGADVTATVLAGDDDVLRGQLGRSPRQVLGLVARSAGLLARQQIRRYRRLLRDRRMAAARRAMPGGKRRREQEADVPLDPDDPAEPHY